MCVYVCTFNFYLFMMQEEERQKLEQAQKQLELGLVGAQCMVATHYLCFCRRVLKRQHKALVRKRCQQIQESLVRHAL